jgi:hypothetical protein
MKKVIFTLAMALLMCLTISSAFGYTVEVTYKAEIIIPDCPVPVAYAPVYQPMYQPVPAAYPVYPVAHQYPYGYPVYNQSPCPITAPVCGIVGAVGDVLTEAGSMVKWTLKSIAAPFNGCCETGYYPYYGVPYNYYIPNQAPCYYYPAPAQPVTRVISGPTVKRGILRSRLPVKPAPGHQEILPFTQQPPVYGPDTNPQPSTPSLRKRIWGGTKY